MARPPRIPVWLPWDQSVIYFITICVSQRKSVLANERIFQIVRQFCDENKNWSTIALTVMPDHIHALVAPVRDRDDRITQFTAGLKRFVRREANAEWKWQDGVFDRLLRSEESIQSKWIYIRENPVRAGLIAQWDEWPYSIGLVASHQPTAA